MSSKSFLYIQLLEFSQCFVQQYLAIKHFVN